MASFTTGSIMLKLLTRFILLAGIIALAACATTQTSDKRAGSKHASQVKTDKHGKRIYPQEKDSAPSGPLPSIFKLLKPKYEPYSRYGNPASYAVDGRTYRVMRSTHGFKERGLASWYGTKFHKQRTSSGEKYDMYAMTAAHKTLPIPSYVRVKNLKNGREAIVKINDRGPFHVNRVIDLSYASAIKLGIYPNGTAPVQIEAINIGQGGKAHVAHYYVQAGVFTSAALANSLKRKLSHSRQPKIVIETWKKKYIVKAGPFADKRHADQFKQQLAKQGVRGSFTIVQ